MKHNIKYIVFAFLSAVFYALNIPLSKGLLNHIGSTLLAGLLYFGAGIGIFVIFLFKKREIKKEELLDKSDLPFVVAMVVLDIVAPILLLLGLSTATAENASLLGNFEIVATTLIALVFFGEKVSSKCWVAIVFITLASFLLSFESMEAFTFSKGSLFVLLATVCWGIENNCTRKLSSKNALQIVTVKGLCCGTGSIVIGLILGDGFGEFYYVLFALLLGFVAYGLSITLYIKAQAGLGASKTSAFYAVNPFVASLLSLILWGEGVSYQYFIALGVMVIGTIFLVWDILKPKKV